MDIINNDIDHYEKINSIKLPKWYRDLIIKYPKQIGFNQNHIEPSCIKNPTPLLSDDLEYVESEDCNPVFADQYDCDPPIDNITYDRLKNFTDGVIELQDIGGDERIFIIITGKEDMVGRIFGVDYGIRGIYTEDYVKIITEIYDYNIKNNKTPNFNPNYSLI